jgi:DNA polymerase III delta prime subunit
MKLQTKHNTIKFKLIQKLNTNNMKYFILIRNTFKKVESFPSNVKESYPKTRIFVFKDCKVLSDRTRKDTIAVMEENFIPEGVFDMFDSIKERIFKLDKTLDRVSSVTDMIHEVLPDIMSMVNRLKILVEQKNLAKMNIGLDLLTIFTTLQNLTINGKEFLPLLCNVLVLVVTLADLFRNLILLYTDEEIFYDVSADFEPESLGALEALIGVGVMETLVPKRYRFLFSSMPLYTKTKVLDEPNFVISIINWLFEIPLLLAETFHFPDIICRSIADAMAVMPFSDTSGLISRMSDLLLEHTEKYNILADDTYIEKVNRVSEELHKWEVKNQKYKSQHPKNVTDIIGRFKHLQKKVSHTTSLTRQEPVFLVFYGPKGTGKTTFMMRLIESLKKNNSVYVHSSPSVEKDFFDMYDMEDVMVIDDIGQKGVYQWANMINFVSTTQCPLDCAAVEKKDVKRMVSKVILATTNNINISLLRSDPIADIEALYRRIHLFDFSEVSFINGVYTGSISIKKRDPNGGTWNVIKELNMDRDTVALRDTASYMIENVKRNKDILKTLLAPDFDLPSLDCESIFNIKIEDHKPLIGILVTTSALLFFRSLYIWKLSTVPERKESKSSVKKKYYTAIRKRQDNLSDLRAEYNSDLFLNKSSDIPVLETFRKNICVLRLLDNDLNDAVVVSSCMLSMRIITTVRHIFYDPQIGKQYWIKVYDSPTHLIYDSINVEIIYISDVDDVVILKIPDHIPVFKKKIPLVKEAKNSNLYLLTPQSVQTLPELSSVNMRQSYKKYNYVNFVEETDTLYNFHGQGFCGSLMVNEEGVIFGHHVAGDSVEHVGVTKIWSMKTLHFLFESLRSDFVVLNTSSENLGANVVPLSFPNVKGTLVKKSDIVPSNIHGIYPVERIPANISVHGNKTTMVQAQKAFEETSFANNKALDWALNNLKNELPYYKLQTKSQIMRGRDGNNWIDTSGSAGYGFPGTKADYLDKVNLNIHPKLQDRVVKILNQIKNGNYDYEDFSEDKLKIELRNTEKANNPRVFTAAAIPLYYLDKMLFGNLVEIIHNDESHNGGSYKYNLGVMVGINPFSSDWADMYNFLTELGPNGFDGDVGKWDKKMLPQFQRGLNRILVEKIVLEDYDLEFGNYIIRKDDVRKVAIQLLETLPSSMRIIGNKTFITTHSLPSGRFLTPDYNSLINKLYNMYIYYKLFLEKHGKEPSYYNYKQDIRFVAYGDDSIIGCKQNVLEWFNAFSYKRIMEEMGLEYTPANKGEWDKPFVGIFDTQFLKRTFRFHPILGKLVSPLEIKSMQSTMNFISDDFRNDELTRIKLYNYQREAFLHPDYEARMQHVKKFIKEIPHLENFSFLDQDVLIDLYRRGEYGDDSIFS